jgi:hypothetical protein
MPFDLSNAPSTFMRMVNDVLFTCLDSFGIVYMDDIVFYGAIWEEHISHLMQVLKTPKKHQLLDNLNKCEFSLYSLVYFRYVIGGGELKIDSTKMEAIIK